MTQIVQAHDRETSAAEQLLEVLREPRTVDHQPVLGHEDGRVRQRHDRPLCVLAFEVRTCRSTTKRGRGRVAVDALVFVSNEGSLT